MIVFCCFFFCSQEIVTPLTQSPAFNCLIPLLGCIWFFQSTLSIAHQHLLLIVFGRLFWLHSHTKTVCCRQFMCYENIIHVFFCCCALLLLLLQYNFFAFNLVLWTRLTVWNFHLDYLCRTHTSFHSKSTTKLFLYYAALVALAAALFTINLCAWMLQPIIKFTFRSL